MGVPAECVAGGVADCVPYVMCLATSETGGNAGTGGDFYGPDTNVKPVTSHNFTSHRDKRA